MRIRVPASDSRSAWASVLQTTKPTPGIPASAIRSTALPPPPPTPTTSIDRARGGSDLDRHLVDLWRRVPGLLVDSHHGFLGWTRRETEHLACLGIEPRALVDDAFRVLDVEVALMRLGELLG